MASLIITEYSNLALNGHAPIPLEPALTEQVVTYTTSTQSAAFGEATRFVRVKPDADCNVKFGSNPTATVANQQLIADVEYWRGVKAGHKVATYDGSS